MHIFRYYLVLLNLISIVVVTEVYILILIQVLALVLVYIERVARDLILELTLYLIYTFYITFLHTLAVPLDPVLHLIYVLRVTLELIFIQRRDQTAV